MLKESVFNIFLFCIFERAVNKELMSVAYSFVILKSKLFKLESPDNISEGITK